MAARRTYEFAGFRLDPAQRRIEQQGEAVALHAKAFDALVYLVEHAGEAVSRRALTEALWPNRVVEENNLTQAISALRRALGDECVVTLAGRGYQFVADVRTVELSSNAEVAATSSDGERVPTPGNSPPLSVTRPPLPARRVLLLVAACAGIVALLASLMYFSSDRIGPAAASATGGEPVKILVRPFETSSQDPDEHAFADALTDELIGGLRTLDGVVVMGRGTSFALRDSPRTGPELAADLGVQYVLEGSVDREGDRLRTRAQLNDAMGFNVWAENFDRPSRNIFDVQDEIVPAIAQRLRAPIGLDGPPPRGTEDTEAYNLVLAARSNVLNDDAPRALDLLERALARDGKFAAAWALQARALVYLSRRLPADERVATRRLARDAADKAMALAPDDGRSHVARATVLAFQPDWLGAESAYQNAYDLGYTDLSDYPVFLLSVGRFASARERFDRRLAEDPLLGGVEALLMLCLELSGQPRAADEQYEHGRVMHGSSWAFGGSVSTWIRLGREGESPLLEEVREPYRQFLDPALEPEDRRARLQSAAAEAVPLAKGYLAVLAAGFNETRLASTLLEEAVTEDALLAYLAWLPVFDEARRTPEFKALLAKVGLVEYWRQTGWSEVCRPVGQNDFTCD